MNKRSLAGIGYQWRQYDSVCRAAALESGDLAPVCGAATPSWFWIVAAVALGAALLWPKGGRA